jgi:hypothetical protein
MKAEFDLENYEALQVGVTKRSRHQRRPPRGHRMATPLMKRLNVELAMARQRVALAFLVPILASELEESGENMP